MQLYFIFNTPIIFSAPQDHQGAQQRDAAGHQGRHSHALLQWRGIPGANNHVVKEGENE